MSEGGRSGLQGRVTRRLLGAMVVVEVALAVALVAGGGRLLLSMQHLLAIDPGFTSEGRLAIDVLLPPQTVRRSRTARRVVEPKPNAGCAPLAQPGSVSPLRCRSVTNGIPPPSWTSRIVRPSPPAGRTDGCASSAPVSFQVFDIRMVAGRSFTADDRAGRRASRDRQSRVGAEVHSRARSPARADQPDAGSRPASTGNSWPGTPRSSGSSRTCRTRM